MTYSLLQSALLHVADLPPDPARSFPHPSPAPLRWLNVAPQDASRLSDMQTAQRYSSLSVSVCLSVRPLNFVEGREGK